MHASLTQIENLGANDIYAWYLASIRHSASPAKHEAGLVPDLKLNLIYPCTPKHIKKYSPQKARVVTETPEIYNQYVRPYMEKQRQEGRLNWVFNILEGRTEVEDVILRQPSDTASFTDNPEGYLLLPDLNWDRKTMKSLHLLALVARRDIWSLRDLKRSHVPWLRAMRVKILDAVVQQYASHGIEGDELKLYVHYQPTYYHFHIHVVHIQLEAGATQAVGKAFSVENLISQLEWMDISNPDTGMKDVDITYTLGEEGDLWKKIFEPQKRNAELASPFK